MPTDDPESRSRLSKCLTDILKDRNCLCYFIQYLETRDALPLIKFWIDVESFQKAAELCSDHDGLVPKEGGRRLHRSVSTDGYDSLSPSRSNSVSMESVSMRSETTLSDVDETAEVKPTTTVATEDDSTSQSVENGGEETVAAVKEQKTRANLQSSVVADAIRIYRKYLVRTSVYFIDVPAIVSSKISLTLCDNNEISSRLFSDAQDYVSELLERDYLEQFLVSVFYCKYTAEVLTSDNLTLHDVLYNETILFYFMEFLEQEDSRNFLEFWLSAVGFKRNNLKHYDKQQAQSDALVLYEKYFSLQATNPLNLSDNVRFQVEERICSVTESISGCFDTPIRIIEYYLDRNYFKPFLKSTIFCKYLSELFIKINECKNGQLKKPPSQHGHRRTQSETFNGTNTLLVMDSKSTTNKTTKSQQSKSNMQIESQQLYDPDVLWQRRDQKVLSFGRVDAFGRYQREFDLDPSMAPENKTSTKLKKVVRKLVNLPEDKVQEEIAWQVAEMIIKDVTSVTLQNEHKPGLEASSSNQKT